MHDGKSVFLDVGIVDAAKHQEYRQAKKALLQGVRRYRALIDTGATSTMITTEVVAQLDLQPVGKKQYHGLQGPSWRSSYLFNVVFYDDEQTHDDEMTRPNPVVHRAFVGQRVINGAEISSSPSFDVLLGMDVISTGDLLIRRDGTFRFDF